MRACFVAAALLAACASQTSLPAAVRQSLNAHYAGRQVELRQSSYYGDLYDENELYLLTAYPFNQTYHIEDTRGAPIHPKNQVGIVPAGTSFTIERVEFPDVGALAKRMLTSPRYNPWIYLKPNEHTNPSLPRDRRAYILLLPRELDSASDVEEELARVLGSAGEVTAWLETRSPTVRAAIQHKDMVVGMTHEELIAAMGPPQTKIADLDAEGQRVDVAWYPEREAWLTNGVVRKIERARPATPTAPGPVRLEPPSDVASRKSATPAVAERAATE